MTRTEAGRELFGAIEDDLLEQADNADGRAATERFRARILAIEAEARAKALAEAEAGVRALPGGAGYTPRLAAGLNRMKAEVLKVLVELQGAGEAIDPGEPNALPEALAYAIVRAPVPALTDTAADVAARLAPLVIESGYLHLSVADGPGLDFRYRGLTSDELDGSGSV